MIVISGSTGFIGQHLLSKLNDSIGVSLRNLAWRSQVEAADTIINLVGKAHDHEGKASEHDYYFANVELAKQVYSAFVKSSASLLIHVSSLAAVEEFESLSPITESDKCNPVTWYGQSKRVCEEWLLAQDIPKDKRLIIIRPPMVHGAGDKGNLGLLYNLISKGIPYPLSSFDNKRSFIAIDNFCYFMRQIIEQQDSLVSGIYHIADDEPVSTKEIIEIIKDVTGKKVPNMALPKFLVKGFAHLGDIVPIPLNSKRFKKLTSNLIVSNVKIKDALGIAQLPLSAADGLRLTIASFKKQHITQA